MNPSSVFENILGIEVLREPPKSYLQDTGAGLTEPLGVLLVKSVEAVPEVLKLCNRHGLAVWPISAGKNFGYGTALPSAARTWILDLSALKGIEIDPLTGLATIEPGVTQGDLFQEISRRGLPFMAPTTGAGPNGAVLGNALDGGYGLNPTTDHFEAITSLKGFWGSGQEFRGTLSELCTNKGLEGWRKGVGPVWSGLLHQSNLGVVTSATIALGPIAPVSRLVLLKFRTEADFYASMPSVQSMVSLCPVVKAVSFNSWSRACVTAGGVSALRLLGETGIAAVEEAIGRETGASRAPRWVGLATLHGTPAAVKGTEQDLRALLPHAAVSSYGSKFISLVSAYKRWYPAPLLRQVRVLENAYRLSNGIPSPEFLSLAYLRKERQETMSALSNPAADGCGVLWYAPLIATTDPLLKEKLTSHISGTLRRHGFLSLLGLSTRTPSIAVATIPILFDKDSPAETTRAKSCLKELIEAGLPLGLVPYRWGSQEMQALHDSSLNAPDSTWSLLKRALDPMNVISPGRYLR